MRRAALIAGGVLVVLAVVAQLVLPGIAERRVRARLREIGDVSGVRVRAFPAVKLLWGNVDFLGARVDQGEASRDELGDLLDQTREIDELEITAPRLVVGGLPLDDVRLDKDAARVEAMATVATTDLTPLAPAGLTLSDVGVQDGRLAFAARLPGLFDSLSGRAEVTAEDGKVVVVPTGALGSLAHVTAFSDPRLRVEDLRARDAGADRVRLTAKGRLGR